MSVPPSRSFLDIFFQELQDLNHRTLQGLAFTNFAILPRTTRGVGPLCPAQNAQDQADSARLATTISQVQAMSLSSAPNSASMAVTATAVSTQQRIADALPPELWTMVMKEVGFNTPTL